MVGNYFCTPESCWRCLTPERGLVRRFLIGGLGIGRGIRRGAREAEILLLCRTKTNKETVMAKIIINPPRGVDLADEFLKALSLLHSNGIKPRTGTKLVSRYAVVVVDDGIADK